MNYHYKHDYDYVLLNGELVPVKRYYREIRNENHPEVNRHDLLEAINNYAVNDNPQRAGIIALTLLLLITLLLLGVL